MLAKVILNTEGGIFLSQKKILIVFRQNKILKLLL